MTSASLQDYRELNMNAWTEIKADDIFHMAEKSIQPFDSVDQRWTIVAIEMNLDSLNYSRSRYNFLDLLAAFGGFMGIWRWIFTTFMAAWNTNALDNFMVSKLYKVQKQDQTKADSKGIEDGLERSRWPHLGDYFLSCLPSCLHFCKKSEKEKSRAKARALLTREMNMVHLL